MVFARLYSREKAELENLSVKLDVPISQIVRDAVRRRIAQLKSDIANNKIIAIEIENQKGK